MSVNIRNYYKFLAPRPTVCVSTLSPDGTSNLAPFSFATPLSFDPPLLGVSVGHGKDTLLNARETEDFVVAPLTNDWKEKGIKSEASLPRERSEFEGVGLTECDSEKIEAPSIEEAPINIECRHWENFETGDHILLVGKVVNVTGKEKGTKGGRINLEELGSVGHVAGEEFCVSNEVIEIVRE